VVQVIQADAAEQVLRAGNRPVNSLNWSEGGPHAEAAGEVPRGYPYTLRRLED
jgi:hypothetical protein